MCLYYSKYISYMLGNFFSFYYWVDIYIYIYYIWFSLLFEVSFQMYNLLIVSLLLSSQFFPSSFLSQSTHILSLLKKQTGIQGKIINHNTIKWIKANKKNITSNQTRKSTRNVYRCRDIHVCTLRNPIETPNLKT